MDNKDEGSGIRTPPTRNDGVQIPTYDELFRLIRAAGPSNPAKARAVDRVLTGARVLIKQSYDLAEPRDLGEQRFPLADPKTDVAGPSVSQQIVRVVGHLLAKAPQWIRQDFVSIDPAVRLRAEDTLAAMIAASLADQIGL